MKNQLFIGKESDDVGEIFRSFMSNARHLDLKTDSTFFTVGSLKNRFESNYDGISFVNLSP